MRLRCGASRQDSLRGGPTSFLEGKKGSGASVGAGASVGRMAAQKGSEEAIDPAGTMKCGGACRFPFTRRAGWGKLGWTAGACWFQGDRFAIRLLLLSESRFLRGAQDSKWGEEQDLV